MRMQTASFGERMAVEAKPILQPVDRHQGPRSSDLDGQMQDYRAYLRWAGRPRSKSR